MKIKSDTRKIEGVHNGEEFTFTHDRALEMFGVTWDREKIKTLVETVSILRLEGHKVKQKLPPQTKPKGLYSLIGEIYETPKYKTEKEDVEEDED